jgi:hypothetical protein
MHLVLLQATLIDTENLLRLRSFLVNGHMQKDFSIVLSSSENTLFRLYTRYIGGGEAIGIEIENYQNPEDRLTIRFTPTNELKMTDQMAAIKADPENIWHRRLETFIESIRSCHHTVENLPITREQFSTFVAYLQTQKVGEPLPLTDHLGVEYCAIFEQVRVDRPPQITILQYTPDDPENKLEFQFDAEGNLDVITINGAPITLEELIDPRNPRSLALYAWFHRLQIQGHIPKERDGSFDVCSTFLPKLLLKGNHVQDRPFHCYGAPNKLFIAPDILNGFRVYLDTDEARLAMIFNASGSVIGVELNGVDYTDQFYKKNDLWKGVVFRAFQDIFAREAVYHDPHTHTLWVHPDTVTIAPLQLATKLAYSTSFHPRFTQIRFLNDLLQEGPALDVGGLSREFFSSFAAKLFSRSSAFLHRREDPPYRP